MKDKGTMKTATRPRGRPKKEEGRIESWQFGRLAMVMCTFDEARKRGEKHSAAITEAVEDVRQRHPKMPISQTTAKRIFAIFRSRNDRTKIVLRFKRSTVGKKKLARFLSMLKQARDSQSEIGLPVPSIQNLPKSLTAYKFGYAKRPRYPRHNRKKPKK